MQAKELMLRIVSNKSPTVVDVRSGLEYKSGHIPAAVHAPLWKILLRLSKLPEARNTEVVLTCEHGPRAQLARGLLGALGYRNVILLEGHMSGWRRAGLPMEK